MLMQILHAGGLPMSYDHSSRPPDDDNPKGYFELEGGKIISRLMDQTFPLEEFKGKFIKITAYGLKFHPPGNYKIIYSQRNIEEIEADIDRLIASLTPVNKEFVDRKLVKLKRERNELLAELEHLKEVPDNNIDVNQLATEIIENMEGFEDVFEEGTLEEKKEFIRLFVDEIKLDAAGMKAMLYIKKFPAPETLSTGNSAFEMVAGARYEAQKQPISPPFEAVELELTRRGSALVPQAA